MSKNALRYRSLLTDTLPYEVPVVFSNNILHASLTSPPTDPSVVKMVSLLRKKQATYSIPYSYDISKGVGRTTTLGIVHPIWQLQIADFYEAHSASMLNYCSDEQFSLRRPSAVASPYMEAGDNVSDGRLKLGVAQLADDAGAPDVTHLTTYFAYRKYNLLGKFADSREHQRLETRFQFRRSLDISKCFYNIYTHSITWAVKGKSFSKEYANSFTFEGEMDSLFQRINYNETNGIVVGPEFSRIFAEIILQRVDRTVVDDLDGQGLEVTKDYDVRRYVDDFYVFANDSDVIDRVESSICRSLEKFKLYLNVSKKETHSRPFVSDISLARHDVGVLIREVRRQIADIEVDTDPSRIAGILRTIRSLLSDVRLAIRKHHVKFENVSGWLLGRYRRIALSALLRAQEAPSLSAPLVDVVTSIVDSVLYVCAVDTRVRTTYSLCQFLEMLEDHRTSFSADQMDQIDHTVGDGIAGILRTALANTNGQFVDTVEVFNLLIGGAKFLGAEFLGQKTVQEVLLSISSGRINYFGYITAKFCMMRDDARFASALSSLNDRVETFLRTEARWKATSEHYLLLCDFISAPDLDIKRKRAFVEAVVGGKPSSATVLAMIPHIGFVDWSGMSVKHLLRRKTLRPVYAWS